MDYTMKLRADVCLRFVDDRSMINTMYLHLKTVSTGVER